jgi:hypothetical protein
MNSMRPMTFMIVVFAVIAVAAIGLIMGMPDLAGGLTLILFGFFAIALAPSLSQMERDIAENSRWIRGDAKSRPFKIRVWGTGFIILGVGVLLDWYFSSRPF